MAQANGHVPPSKDEVQKEKTESVPSNQKDDTSETTAVQKKTIQPNMADVVKTMMTVRKWLMSQQEDEHQLMEDIDAENSLISQISNIGLQDKPEAQVSLTFTEKFKKHISDTISFSIDPNKSRYYYETCLVTVACLYNLMIIVARWAFDEMQTNFRKLWIVLDYTADTIYLFDTLIESRKGFLEDGVMVRDPKKLLKNYTRDVYFWPDLISILPTDFLYLIWPNQPLIRANRLARIHRISDFSDRTETRTTFPNIFRVIKLIAQIFIIFHWNASAFYTISSKWYGVNKNGIGRTLVDETGDPRDNWVFEYHKILDPIIPICSVWDEGNNCTSFDGDMNHTFTIQYSDLTKQYLFSFYWSALILTTLGEQVTPIEEEQFLFVIVDILFGLLIFATIVGNVGTMVTNMNAAKSEFEETLDGVKQYMDYRKVHPKLQKRVGKWFGYIWQQGQSLDEDSITRSLPTKLKAELAIQVHMETLKRVRIFQDCEPGLLVELVLKLKLQIYSPGDYICKKGDVGKEMYIVKRGSLNVVAEDGIKVFVTLKEGSVFGELSVLDIPGSKNGNKRTAGVRSVGYSDLFALSKDNLWDALRDYPDAKKILMAKGREILRKDNLLNESVVYQEVGPTKTITQKMDNFSEQLRVLNENMDALYKRFGEDTARMKQRVTELERTFKENRQKIKRDCLLGLL